MSGAGPTALELTVNGRPRRLAAGATVATLLAELDCDPRTVAVERNGTILGRGDHAATPLATGDRLEIVRFVQGG